MNKYKKIISLIVVVMFALLLFLFINPLLIVIIPSNVVLDDYTSMYIVSINKQEKKQALVAFDDFYRNKFLEEQITYKFMDNHCGDYFNSKRKIRNTSLVNFIFIKNGMKIINFRDKRAYNFYAIADHKNMLTIIRIKGEKNIGTHPSLLCLLRKEESSFADRGIEEILRTGPPRLSEEQIKLFFEAKDVITRLKLEFPPKSGQRVKPPLN